MLKGDGAEWQEGACSRKPLPDFHKDIVRDLLKGFLHRPLAQ